MALTRFGGASEKLRAGMGTECEFGGKRRHRSTGPQAGRQVTGAMATDQEPAANVDNADDPTSAHR